MHDPHLVLGIYTAIRHGDTRNPHPPFDRGRRSQDLKQDIGSLTAKDLDLRPEHLYGRNKEGILDKPASLSQEHRRPYYGPRATDSLPGHTCAGTC